ncbi:DUF2635 domain-containing protein [Rhizobium sp.]|uniref:DUF2635 domain-containing protein n=1 Tax=Rhizobium sp. TaxID=391 RepID=UPI003F81FBA4
MKKFLKQAEGRTVPQQDGTAWPADGMDAEDTLYVRRRIADGDLVEVPAPSVPIEPPAGDPPSNDPPATSAGGKPKGAK